MKLLDVEFVEVISLVVVKGSASFVVLFKVVWRVVLLVLVVATSFVVKVICPVAVVGMLVPRNVGFFISVLSVVDVVVSVVTGGLLGSGMHSRGRSVCQSKRPFSIFLQRIRLDVPAFLM